MRAQVEATALRKATSYAGIAVQKNWSPVMESLLIEAKDNTLRMTGHSPEIQTAAWCEAAVSDAGGVCVNAADMQAVAKQAKGVVSIALEDSFLSMSFTGGSVKLPTLVAEFPQIDTSDAVEVEGGSEAFARAVKFCDINDTREMMHGVYFCELGVVSARDAMVYREKMDCAARGGVPATALRAIQSAAGRLFVAPGTWRAEGDGVLAIGACLAAERPAVERILSGEANEVALCDADELLAAVEAATFGRAAHCFFKWNDGFTLSGERFPTAHVDTSFAVSAEGAGGDFLLSVKLLRTCLEAVKGSVVSLSALGPGIAIQPEGADRTILLGVLRDNRTRLPSQQKAA